MRVELSVVIRAARALPEFLVTAAAALMLLGTATGHAATYVADPAATSGPSYYRNLLDRLEPGDTLELPAGTYRERLNLTDLQGTAGAWITITGPASGPPAIVTTQSNCCNTVQLGNTSYVAIRNLVIDSNSEAVDESIDGINAQGGATHDILIENCTIRGVSHHQLTVGISTKSTAWNWTIRGNTIIEAGTGAYLGNSDGSAPFVAGVIEHNLFVDTIGYNMEIKYQNPYTAPAGMPAGARKTVIRHNVFLKRRAQSGVPADKLTGARPNLLVGGFPDSGAGANDIYEIYGNLFYRNLDGESLLQASGRVSIHDNVFVDAGATAILLQDHDRPLKHADVYNNTIYRGDRGIRFASSARQRSTVVGNLVFAAQPISGTIGSQAGNITAPVADAAQYVQAPSVTLGQMNFYPIPGQVEGAALDLSAYATDTDFNRDFNGTSKGDGRFRGAYAGAGSNPGWQLNATVKPAPNARRPSPPTDLKVQ